MFPGNPYFTIDLVYYDRKTKPYLTYFLYKPVKTLATCHSSLSSAPQHFWLYQAPCTDQARCSECDRLVMKTAEHHDCFDMEHNLTIMILAEINYYAWRDEIDNMIFEGHTYRVSKPSRKWITMTAQSSLYWAKFWGYTATRISVRTDRSWSSSSLCHQEFAGVRKGINSWDLRYSQEQNERMVSIISAMRNPRGSATAARYLTGRVISALET